MAKHITVLALLLTALSFLFLAPGAVHDEVPASGGKTTVSAGDSKIDKILEEKRVPADEAPDDVPEETTAEADDE